MQKFVQLDSWTWFKCKTCTWDRLRCMTRISDVVTCTQSDSNYTQNIPTLLSNNVKYKRTDALSLWHQNRAPRWTFMDPCKPEVRPGAREESASPAGLADKNEAVQVCGWRHHELCLWPEDICCTSKGSTVLTSFPLDIHLFNFMVC